MPTTIIDQRVKNRVICPQCNTSRSLKLLPTKEVGYDKESDEFYLMCDNFDCKKARMVTKEGDELGIEPIRARLEKDETLMKQVYGMHGISKILLRNSIPKDRVDEFANDYEITPEYYYHIEAANNTIETKEKPWEINDDQGVACNSLMPPPVVVSLIKQLVKELGL